MRTAEQVQFRIEVLFESTPVRGNAMHSGDAKADRRAENKIIKECENGNEWAWCTVRVVAWDEETDLAGDDYLGCCSYRDRKDFMKGGYYEDMKERALEDLNAKIDAAK